MKIIKRNGAEVPFDITKIITAVTKASDSVGGKARLSREQITDIAAAVTDQCQALNRAVSVEEVQDMVENQLMDIKAHDIARHYITYRYIQSLKRQTNTTDERILSLIECQNEEVKQENANKNPTVNSVQRDYMAGEISKDLTARLLLDPEIVKAHQEGLIHFHDSDYFAQHMHNCDLVNLDDMLQNGTVISGTYIEKPHSFSTACNIATQIIAQVASNQYGGQSISLTHLAPFVDVSRKKIAAEVEAEMEGLDVSAERKREIVERRLRSEINRGVQTIQYQVVTLMTTNGQAPFITVFMYLGEARNAQEKADLAIIIEETIRQRYQGVKNEAGVWITPAFPKLVYVLDEHNCLKGGKYDYITELAVRCSAKRMYPDYISAKKMRENYEGNVFSPMGCRSFLSPWKDENGNYKFEGRFNQGVVSLNLPQIGILSKGDEDAFWKLLAQVDSLYVLASRIVWSMVLTGGILLLRRDRLAGVRAAFRDRREWGLLAAAGCVVCVNWGVYIWAVANGHMIDSSLAYYMNPILAILLGTVLFRERLTKLQWLAVAVTFAGLVITVIRYRQIPWIALVIGGSFAVYGALKKQVRSDAAVSTFVETLTLAPFALVLIFWMEAHGTGAAGVLSGWQWLLLPVSGVVTTVPLMFFAAGMKTTPMTLSGILMYINPTMQLLLSVALYGEAFTATHAILFGFVWTGLILYLISGARESRRHREEEKPCV